MNVECSGLIHVNRARQDKKLIIKRTCPMCPREYKKKKTFFIGYSQDWYGPYVTCLRCGGQVQGGEYDRRPRTESRKIKNINSEKSFYRAEVTE